MTSPTVQFDFGDGTKVDGTNQGGGTWSAEHTYDTPGDYKIKASAGDVEGECDYTVPDDSGEDGPAQPTLSIPDLSLTQGDTDEAQSTTLTNRKGESQNCTGKITIKNGSALNGKITMKMPDFFGAGTGDVTVQWTVQGNDLVGTYPGGQGFPILNPLDGATDDLWSLTDDAPVNIYQATTQTLDEDGGVLASDDWVLTTRAKMLPKPTITAVNPSSGNVAAGDTVTVTGTNFVSGTTGFLRRGDGTNDSVGGVTFVSATQVTFKIPTAGAGRKWTGLTIGTPPNDSNLFTIDLTVADPAPPPAPTLTSVTPDSGEVADRSELALVGTNFATGLNALLYAEESGGSGTGVPTAVSSATEATVSLRTADTPVIKRVSVTMPGGDESNDIDVDLTVAAATNGTSGATFTPTEGPVGTTVTVTGSGFSNVDNLTVKPPEGDRDFAVDHFNKQGDTTITFDIKNTFQTGPHTVSIYRSSVREDLADKFTVTA